jgi:hypothetical protein
LRKLGVVAALGLIGAHTRTAPTAREQVIQSKHNATLHHAIATDFPLENATYYPSYEADPSRAVEPHDSLHYVPSGNATYYPPHEADPSKPPSVESHPYRHSHDFRRDIEEISHVSDDPHYDQFRKKHGDVDRDEVLKYLRILIANK